MLTGTKQQDWGGEGKGGGFYPGVIVQAHADIALLQQVLGLAPVHGVAGDPDVHLVIPGKRLELLQEVGDLAGCRGGAHPLEGVDKDATKLLLPAQCTRNLKLVAVAALVSAQNVNITRLWVPLCGIPEAPCGETG